MRRPSPRARALLALAALACGVAAAPRPAAAEAADVDAALVTVPSRGASPEEATRALAPIGGLLQRRSGRRVVLPQVAVTRLAASEGQVRLEEARREGALARETARAFEDLDLAAERLEAAAALYLELLPMLDSAAEPLELLRELATVRLAQDRGEEVDRALEELSRLDPELRSIGASEPVRLRRAAARFLSGGGGDAPLLAPELARSYADLLGAVRLGVARLEPSGRVRVDVFHRAQGERTATLELDPDDPEGAARELGEALGIGFRDEEPEEEPPPRRAARGRAPRQAPLPEEPPRSEAPWYHSWWFWTTVGVVVVGVALVVGIVVSSSDE